MGNTKIHRMENAITLKITLIEDDLLLREMIYDFLKKKYPFATVSLFNSGEAALEYLHVQQDLVLLDFNLSSQEPGRKNGIDVLKELKKNFPGMPVVFVSGQDNPEVALSTIKHGAWDYIIKNDNIFNRLDVTLNQVLGEVKDSKQRSWMPWLIAAVVLVLAAIMYALR